MLAPKEQLIEAIDPMEFWMTEFPEWEGQGNVQCPRTELHERGDEGASLSLHPQGKFHCFGCGWKGTSVIGYYADAHCDGNFRSALARLFSQHIQPLVKMEVVNKSHKKLMKRARIQQHLLARRGWTEETLVRFFLGWNHEEKRVTIPIFNPEMMVLDYRKYDALRQNRDQPKMLQWEHAISGLCYPLWGAENPFEKEEVILVEGEPDAILGRQEGLNAHTWTGGCDVLKALSYDKLQMYEHKHVVICLDADKPGDTAAHKLAKRMAAIEIASLKIINVPEGNDLTDYLVEKGGTAESFIAFLRQAPYVIRPSSRKITEVPLAETSRPELVGKPVMSKVLASGKGQSPLVLPKRIEFRCAPGDGGYCSNCPCKDTGKEDFFIQSDDPKFLSWMTTPDYKWQDLIKDALGLTCKTKMALTTLEQQTVEFMTLIPALQNKDLTEETVNRYVTRQGYFVGHGLETNKHFNIKAIPQAHPKTRESVLVIREAEGAKDSFETFHLSKKDIDGLKRLFAGPAWDSLKAVASALSRNHTKIRGRSDLHIAVDLCFHSPLAFSFDGTPIPKGSLELLLLGDTRTGKGTVAEGLVRLYDLGTVVSGENSSFMGLVGGVSKLGGSFTLQWGAFPLNHGRLVAVDEVSGLDDILGKLSRVRSEGIAEINKGGINSRTNANTRVIWIANPRKGREIADFGTGVESVLDLARTQEDVARFDLVVIVSKDEVSAELINQRAQRPIKTNYTPARLRKLVLWVWSRKPNQIEFTDECVKCVLANSIFLADKYSAAIPLVQGENIRFKLAKLAASIAGRVFSTPDGVRLVVKKEHALIAVKLLQWFYDKETCGYGKFSEARQSKEQIINKEEIDAIFELFPATWSDVVDGILEAHEISVRDFQDWLDIDRTIADKFTGTLVRCHALRKKRGGFYAKRTGFIKYLIELQQKGLPSSRKHHSRRGKK